MADGLLGEITRRAQGLLGNPFVQGVSGAAAFGANPLLGLLLGSELKRGRDRREVGNEIERRKLSGLERLPGLLSDQTTVQDPRLETGLLNLEGGVDPLSIPGRRRSVPAASTPEGQAELLGALTDISPQTGVQGLLSSILPQTQRAAPAVVRVADELGLTGEDRNDFIRKNFNPNAGAEAQQATIDLMQAQIQLLNATDDRERTIAEEGVERAEFNNSLNTTVDNLFELADVNEQLSSTGQRPGFGAEARSAGGSAIAFGADVLGFDEFAGEVQSNVNLAERFDTLANEILIDSLNTGNFDARTDTKFRQFSSTKPTRAGMGSRANSLAIADKFDAALLAADANNTPISPERRAQIEQRVKSLREFQLSPASLLQMSLEDILNLDPEETDRYTEEQRQALSIRIQQLRQQ